MDGVQTAVVSTCISCKTGTWRHVVCASVCVCVCARVFVFALCVVWHIFTEGCVLSLSFGVRPEAMSNWSLHTFRLDSHWHARPWLSSLCHEKGKQWHRNMPSSLLRRESLLILISFLFYPSFFVSSALVACFKRMLESFFRLRSWTFQPQKHDLRDTSEGHNCLTAPYCYRTDHLYSIYAHCLWIYFCSTKNIHPKLYKAWILQYCKAL